VRRGPVGTLIVALVAIAAAWLLVGAIVATFVMPWREVSIHARWAPMQLEPDRPPRSPWYVSLAWWLICAALWPFAWRWVRQGVFAGSSTPPLEQLPPNS